MSAEGMGMGSPADHDVLFSVRACVQTFGGDGSFSETTLATLAFSRAEMFVDGYRLPWAGIDCIKRNFGGVAIKHRVPGVPPSVLAHKFRLFGKLQEAVRQHQIEVRMEA